MNARAETIDEKNSFRESFKKRRCLVLADGFYEWKETGNGKQPYRVVTEDSGLIAMVGVWEQWIPPEDASQADLEALAANDSRSEEEKDSKILESFTIITTEPNDTVSEIHNRMPVVLESDEENHWLTGDSEDLKSLLDPYSADRMNAYPRRKASQQSHQRLSRSNHRNGYWSVNPTKSERTRSLSRAESSCHCGGK
ncbi:SOS response-associated peptidase [Haladaptatus halobius]|uniref:SOS response-associated peptidase n=1 Tax=Haladaptatus halobius TaxID=2884875 RepID=UPI002107C9B7|nr:SOS response-associated peptidase [Haladaptatus halobius]